MVLVPTVNIAEEFYKKMLMMNKNKDKSIILCIKDNAFKTFNNSIRNECDVIITTYNTESKCLGDVIEEYYMKEKRLNYTLIVDESNLLLQYISLIEITKEFDKVGLISATSEYISGIGCFKDYICINPYIDVGYKRNIYVRKLNNDVDEQRKAVIDLIRRERNKYERVLV